MLYRNIKSVNGLKCPYTNVQDYDGDELNVSILLDNNMAEQFKTLQPFFNVPDIAKPYEISGNLGLLSPSTSIVANFLYDTVPSTRKDQVSSSFNYVDF